MAASIRALIKQSPAARAAALAYESIATRGDDPEAWDDYRIIAQISERKGQLDAEQGRLRDLFRRLDNLYYPSQITLGGADHWPDATLTAGKAHVSVNDPQVYVDVPAGLQSVPPVENYVGKDSSDEERGKAARAERLYFQWNEDEQIELKDHKACIVKGLYGFTYGKVWWNPIEKRPSVTIIEQPENLFVGWGASDFSRIDWTVYCYGLSAQAIEEEYGLDVVAIKGDGGKYFSYVSTGRHEDPLATMWGEPVRAGRVPSAYEQDQVEVYDYWYKKSAGKGRKPEIWNAIYAGNALVSNAKHPEYDDIPYLPLPNTFIPGSPYGRSELYDLEQLFREKDERLTNAAQMLSTVVGGQMWQLTGSDATEDVPPNAIPKPNKVATPGPNARIEAIQPFMPEFQIMDYLNRIDKEIEEISGLGPILLSGQAQNLGSSKVIAAIVAQYESRIRMKRDLFYQWRKRRWAMAAKVWEYKSRDVKAIIDGNYRIDISPPELTPRDELENAQKAINLVQNRIWSAKRAMDATGVEDPEDETSLIKVEQTDPALNPAAVQAQVSLMAALQQFGPQGAPTPGQAANTARTTNPAATGSQSLNGPENAANPPPESLPANALAGGAKAQTIVQDGEASGRLLTQQAL